MKTAASTADNSQWLLLFSAWMVALVSTLGALFSSEIMGLEPCLLCWYQRIAMFPLALMLAIALLPFDARVVRYALPLAIAGAGVAAYHCLLVWGVVPKDLVPCGQGPSCAEVKLERAGLHHAAVAVAGGVFADRDPAMDPEIEERGMNKSLIVIATVATAAVAFFVGSKFYQQSQSSARTGVAAEKAANLVRPHSPVFGGENAKVTIVEFLDPACETCGAMAPLVKSLVTASFGQVRLVVRYAPLHQGSDQIVRILEAARLQGKYWQALEAVLASQSRWASHDNPRPELVWDIIGSCGSRHRTGQGGPAESEDHGNAQAGSGRSRRVEGEQDA